jgi:ParB family transcriptional regulator, chromosome partitioning protein
MTAHGIESRVTELRPDQIDIGPRLRPVDPDHVAFIATSMADAGQLQPVVVRPPDEGTNGPYRLVMGAHRVEACRLLGHQVRVVVRPMSDAQAALAEVDENLARHDLTELDRSAFMATRKRLYVTLHPETGHGRAKKGKVDKNVHLIPSFADDVAAKLGIDARTVRRAVHRFEHIAPEVRARIAGTAIARKAADLDELAKIVLPEQQMARVERVLKGEARSVRDAAGTNSRGGEALSIAESRRRKLMALLLVASADLKAEALAWLLNDKKAAAAKARKAGRS